MRLYIFIYNNQFGCVTLIAENNIEPKNYIELVQLFEDWRDFENPPLMNGAPDYTKRRFDHAQEFNALQNRLENVDTTNWPIYYQVDWWIVHYE